MSVRSSWPGESTDRQYDPFRSSLDLGLTWPEVKLWPWPLKVISYMVRRALTRQTRWYQIRCSIFKIKDFIVEKPFWKILEFWPLETTIYLSQKMTEMISKWFFASFRTLPFVFLYGNQEPRSWGGGGVQTPPPPPSRRWEIQRPSRARVNPRPDEVWRVTRPDEGVAQRAPLRIFKSNSRRVKIQMALERSRRTLQDTIMLTLFFYLWRHRKVKNGQKSQNVLIYRSQLFVT